MHQRISIKIILRSSKQPQQGRIAGWLTTNKDFQTSVTKSTPNNINLSDTEKVIKILKVYKPKTLLS